MRTSMLICAVTFFAITSVAQIAAFLLYAFVFPRLQGVKGYRLKAQQQGSCTVVDDLAAVGIHTDVKVYIYIFYIFIYFFHWMDDVAPRKNFSDARWCEKIKIAMRDIEMFNGRCKHLGVLFASSHAKLHRIGVKLHWVQKINKDSRDLVFSSSFYVMSHIFRTLNLLAHDNRNSGQWLIELGALLRYFYSATNAPNQQLFKRIAKWEMLIVKMRFPTGNKSMYLFLTILFSMPAGCWSWKGFTPEYISTLCPEVGLCSLPDGSIRSVGVYNSRVLVWRYWAPQARILVSGLKHHLRLLRKPKKVLYFIFNSAEMYFPPEIQMVSSNLRTTCGKAEEKTMKSMSEQRALYSMVGIWGSDSSRQSHYNGTANLCLWKWLTYK